jgi:cephalosporin-C deacetylase-like acetyl esterase
MEMYQENGFATFELNSFKSRDIKSTVGSQVEVTTAAIILDAYKAFAVLSNHPNIDKNKVSITGWSLGVQLHYFLAGYPLRKLLQVI